MSHEENVTERVMSILAVNTGYDAEEISLDAHFEDDLGMTKPDFIRVVTKINTEFEINLNPTTLFEEVETVQELVSLVEDEKLWG